MTANGINICSYDMTSLTSAAYMKIHLEQSKTDPFRSGTDVIVSNKKAIHAMALYLSKRSHIKGAQPLFIDGNHNALTVKTLVSATQYLLALAGIQDVQKYKGHSFRKGGATSLHVAGFSDSIIRIMGRWHSFAFARYIDAPMHTIIEAGQCMTSGNNIISA